MRVNTFSQAFQTFYVCMYINRKNTQNANILPQKTQEEQNSGAVSKLEPLKFQRPHLRNFPKRMKPEYTRQDPSVSVSQLSTTFKTFKLKMLLFQFTTLDTQKGWGARLTVYFPTRCWSAFLVQSKVFTKISALQKILNVNF